MPLVRVRDRRGRVRLMRAAPSRRGMKFVGDPEQQIQEMMKDLSRMTGVLTQLSRDRALAPISRDLRSAASDSYKMEQRLRSALTTLAVLEAEGGSYG